MAHVAVLIPARQHEPALAPLVDALLHAGFGAIIEFYNKNFIFIGAGGEYHSFRNPKAHFARRKIRDNDNMSSH